MMDRTFIWVDETGCGATNDLTDMLRYAYYSGDQLPNLYTNTSDGLLAKVSTEAIFSGWDDDDWGQYTINLTFEDYDGIDLGTVYFRVDGRA